MFFVFRKVDYIWIVKYIDLRKFRKLLGHWSESVLIVFYNYYLVEIRK